MDCRRGFTLVEIMIVVVIIGLLAALAIPAFQKVRTETQGNRVANDMRIFRDAVEAYVLKEGGFPVHDSGGLPAVLQGWISQEKWNEGSALANGAWEYYNPGNGTYIPEIVLDTPGGANSAIFQIVDEKLDDGSATSGSITYQDEYVLLSFTQ